MDLTQPQQSILSSKPVSIHAQSFLGSDENIKNSKELAVNSWSTTPPIQLVRALSETPFDTQLPVSLSEDFSTLSNWNSPIMHVQSLHENFLPSSNCYLHQDFYADNKFSIGESKPFLNNGDQFSQGSQADSSLASWNSEFCDDAIEMHNFDNEINFKRAVQEYTAYKIPTISDPKYTDSRVERDVANFKDSCHHGRRRMSGSSFSMSTTGPLLDMQQSYEDYSASLSDANSFSSPDQLSLSNRNSMMSSTQLSPVASPHVTPQHRPEFIWSQNCSHATPSPRASMRSAPYSVENSRNKRWSTGSYAPTLNRRQSPFFYRPYQGHEVSDSKPHQISSRHSSPTIPNMQDAFQANDFPQEPQFPLLSQSYFQPQISASGGRASFSQTTNALVLSQSFDDRSQFESRVASSFTPNGFFKMLQSNADAHTLQGHYDNLSDPPDLYSSLHEEHILPPPEDMNPADPDLIPYEQDLRFDEDLYTPRWVRGHGNRREGWCGICKPGRWLILKNSAFWYDKSFTHGISAATGSPFREPQETRRMDGNPDVWEGLCGSCNEWVVLVSSKKKGTTWFRHAYKCHTHLKIKDAPKRRRESINIRNVTASKIVKSKHEESTLTPPKTRCDNHKLYQNMIENYDVLSASHRKLGVL